ncbi:dicarboxylic amino acid permease [[Candida] jaroonii]|uniref:Dicarboxylic amino acid permease n=1 Tax=[Candida] jaroonii TaxID=467808 RepID=A0ACA9YBQ5_9ASCO|nr:dicarboxylic amino acid permease [[Candida] jaroonii]
METDPEKNEKKQGIVIQTDIESIIDNESHDGSTVGTSEDYTDHFMHDKKLKKALNSRHLSIITVVSVFGTGLFLSSGGTLAKTGPVGIIICYIAVGTIVAASQMCMAECSCLAPFTSGYIRHANMFISPSLGFTLGWIDVYGSIIPTELSAITVVMRYWSDLNPAVWVTIFGVAMVVVNSYNVRWYGEIEFVFGLLKLSLIIILVVVGLVIDLGGTGDRIGFRYWVDPGPFAGRIFPGSLGHFIGFWSAINSVVYSYGGVQAVSLLSGETTYPRRSIYRAAKKVFFITFSFYLAAVFMLSLIVPSNNKVIASPTGTASASPFVVAMSGQIDVLPHYINAVVVTSALSAGFYSITKSSRVLFALAAKDQAPKIFLRVNRNGLPYVAVIFVCAWIPLAYMACSSGSANVFSWFQNITSSNLLLGWIIISLNHIFLNRALKAQGYSRKDLPYTFPGTVFASWYALFFSALFLLTGGFINFIHGQWDFGSFFGAYFIIPLSLSVFIGHSIWSKKFINNPAEVDLKSLFQHVQDNPEPPFPKLKGLKKINYLWS